MAEKNTSKMIQSLAGALYNIEHIFSTLLILLTAPCRPWACTTLQGVLDGGLFLEEEGGWPIGGIKKNELQQC